MSVLNANIDVLEERFPSVARSVKHAHVDASVEIETARSGDPTLRLRTPDGPGAYLHSRFDPRREGRRRGDEVSPRVGYLVMWGPGLFYEVDHLFDRPGLRRLVALEPDRNILRAALAARDLSRVLRDPRLHLLVGGAAGASEAARYVGATYLPALHGALRVETPRPRAEEAKQTTEAVESAATRQLEDLSIQRRFGLRWFSNALRNLVTVDSPPVRLPTQPAAVVAAAGPSLEAAAAGLNGGVPVISTDTALPVLLQNGIKPIAVVSLDCQQVSYHHLLVSGHEARELPLVADLSSPPTLLRHARRTVPAAGGHPFARLIQQRLGDIPFIDGSGGNVTQAAVSLAGELGAKQIFLVGADHSYPQGKPYARDCYVYPHFRSRETRLKPAHAQLWDMALADPETRSEATHEDPTHRTYRTPKLDQYRTRLEEYISTLEAEVIFAPPSPRMRVANSQSRVFSLPDPAVRRNVLEELTDELEALELPDPHAGEQPERRQLLWYALMPSAAAFVGGSLDVRATDDVLSNTRQWAVQALRRVTER